MEKDWNKFFIEKVEKLESELPKMTVGVNCAELTFTNILDVLGMDSYIFHNLAMPLAGGFGGYKAKDGWQGACGAVAGACAAIGIIIGGKKKMNESEMTIAYLKAAKYCSDFEEQFGSVVCAKLCGYDFSKPEGLSEYRKSGTWQKKCNKYVIWAVNHVSKLTSKNLKSKW